MAAKGKAEKGMAAKGMAAKGMAAKGMATKIGTMIGQTRVRRPIGTPQPTNPLRVLHPT